MRLEVTPKEPCRVRIKHNGKVILEETLEAGVACVVQAEHPKCGKAEVFRLNGDAEIPMGVADYGDCQCQDGPHTA